MNNIFKHFDLSLVFTLFYVSYDEILSENFKDMLVCLVSENWSLGHTSLVLI